MKVLKRDNLQLGGFAGLKEHQLVIDHRVGGSSKIWDGIGNFVYLADAQFNPFGETRLHSHREIDVISVMVEGNIAHEGSMQHGGSFGRDQVQVQRAGGQGFSHNEINPDNTTNRMIQLWVLPEVAGEPAGYRLYDLQGGQLSRIYGGAKNQTEYMYSDTVLEVGCFNAGQSFISNNDKMIYITRGSGELSDKTHTIVITDGDLIHGTDMSFKASSDDVQIIVIGTEKN